MTGLVVGAAVVFGFAGVAVADAIPPTEGQVRSAARELVPGEYEVRDEWEGAPRTWLFAQAAYAAQIIADPGEDTREDQRRTLAARAQELGWEFQPNRLDSLRYTKDGMRAHLISGNGETYVRVQRAGDRWSRLELGVAGVVLGAALGGVGSVAWGRRRRAGVPASRD